LYFNTSIATQVNTTMYQSSAANYVSWIFR